MRKCIVVLPTPWSTSHNHSNAFFYLRCLILPELQDSQPASGHTTESAHSIRRDVYWCDRKGYGFTRTTNIIVCLIFAPLAFPVGVLALLMNPKSQEFGAEGENPFRDLRIDDVSFLDDIDNRSQCINCKKSRKYFCYTCYVPVEALNGRIPQLKLPIKIDIIKHSREIDGKSTAAHAAVLAGNDVSVYTFPCVPDYKPSDKVVVVYPGKNAMTLAEYFSANRNKDDSGEPRAKRRNTGAGDPIGEPPDSSNIASSDECVLRAVFIDSTWNQSRGMFKDPRLHSLPCVVLGRRLSHFWRHQSGSPRWYLATIEAIHQFLFEFHNLTDSQPYSGQYDNLLFFFRYMYSKIHKLYDHDDLKAYKRPVE